MVKVHIRERKVSLGYHRSRVIWAVTSYMSWLYMQHMHICIYMYIYSLKYNLLSHISYLYACFQARPFGTGKPIGVLLLGEGYLFCFQFHLAASCSLQCLLCSFSLYRDLFPSDPLPMSFSPWLGGTKYNP